LDLCASGLAAHLGLLRFRTFCNSWFDALLDLQRCWTCFTSGDLLPLFTRYHKENILRNVSFLLWSDLLLLNNTFLNYPQYIYSNSTNLIENNWRDVTKQSFNWQKMNFIIVVLLKQTHNKTIKISKEQYWQWYTCTLISMHFAKIKQDKKWK
jgi:hypothetical protein